jgi:hypothetical protein
VHGRRLSYSDAETWNRLNALVEKRGGKPGIEIDQVEIVAPCGPAAP